MTQGLGWEIYDYPTDLDAVAGRQFSRTWPSRPTRWRNLPHPLPPQEDVLINKTGSTNGFGAYAAFVPAKGIGIVMLANKNYPNADRVKAAYRIMTALDRSLD